jgi:hypothetical protein
MIGDFFPGDCGVFELNVEDFGRTELCLRSGLFVFEVLALLEFFIFNCLAANKESVMSC